MSTEAEVKEEVFSSDLLFDFSEVFKRNKEANPRRSIEFIFQDTCREFRIFGDRQKKFFDAFTVYRMTVRIPEGIMERARFLPVEVPTLPRPIIIQQVEQPKKASPLLRISVKGDDAPDRHESQLPRGDRNRDD